MTNDRVELMLDAITNAQNRLATYLAVGFVSGFALGVMAAWIMFTTGR